MNNQTRKAPICRVYANFRCIYGYTTVYSIGIENVFIAVSSIHQPPYIKFHKKTAVKNII